MKSVLSFSANMGNRMGGACVSKVGCLSGYLTEEQLLREFQASNSSC